MGKEDNIRALTVGDTMIIIEALDGVVSNIGDDELKGLLSGGSEDAGIVFVKAAIKHAPAPVYKVLASALSMSLDEFNDQPAYVAIETAEAIYNDKRNADFFTKLRSMLS